MPDAQSAQQAVGVAKQLQEVELEHLASGQDRIHPRRSIFRCHLGKDDFPSIGPDPPHYSSVVCNYVPCSARQMWFLESPTTGFHPKPCRYSRLSLRRSHAGRQGWRFPSQGGSGGAWAALHPLLSASQPAVPWHSPSLLDPAASVSWLCEEGPCSWLSTGWGRWQVPLSGEIRSGVQLPRCTLPAGWVRDPQGRMCHPRYVAAPPFLGVSVDPLSRGSRDPLSPRSGEDFPPCFPVSKWEHCVILGYVLIRAIPQTLF